MFKPDILSMRKPSVIKTTPERLSLESSFTLLETVIAIGIIASVMMEVIAAQGNIVYFSGYSRRMTEATWLAKRLMSQVEYHWHSAPFKDLDKKETDKAFEDGMENSDYLYDIEIKTWKLPLLDLLTGKAGAKDDEGQATPGGAAGSQAKDIVASILGEELLKTAHVSVSWPEGAKRNSIDLTYLMTNQRKIDEFMNSMNMEKQYNDIKQKLEVERNPGAKPPPPPTTGGTTTGGTTTGGNPTGGTTTGGNPTGGTTTGGNPTGGTTTGGNPTGGTTTGGNPTGGGP